MAIAWLAVVWVNSGFFISPRRTGLRTKFSTFAMKPPTPAMLTTRREPPFAASAGAADGAPTDGSSLLVAIAPVFAAPPPCGEEMTFLAGAETARVASRCATAPDGYEVPRQATKA